MSFDREGERRKQQAEQLFRLGRIAVKSGERQEGYQMLRRVVDLDRDHSEAWLWLAAATDDLAEQKQCLEWAIAADPGNAAARRGLAILTGKLNPQDQVSEDGVKPQAKPRLQVVAVNRTFTCPKCGGPMRFEPEIVDLQCVHCGYVEVVEEEALKDGEQVLDFALPSQTAHHWAEGERLFTCQQCSASTLLPVGQKTSACPFCGHTALVAAPEEAKLILPHGLIPMGFELEPALEKVRAWLNNGWFAPGDLQKLARNKQLTPAYVPIWTFNATLNARWSAEVQVGYGKTARWEQRSGFRTKFFTNELIPAIKALPIELLRKIFPFDLTKLLKYKPEYLAAWPAAVYDLSLADASLLARERMVKEARHDLQVTAAPGNNIRNLEVATDEFTGQTYKLILAPVWIGTYRYQDKTFRVLVNGQTGQVAGQQPIAWSTVALVATAVLMLIGLLVTVGAVILPRLVK